MLGLLNDKQNLMTFNFKSKGACIFLLGASKNDISSSEYLYSFHNVKNSPAPYFDIEEELKLHKIINRLIKDKLIRSAHDVSDGGLFIALLESSMPNGLGFDITTDSDIRTDAFLFGEAQGRVVVSVDNDHEAEFIDTLSKSKVPVTLLGHVTKGEMRIDDKSFGFVDEAKQRYDNALEEHI